MKKFSKWEIAAIKRTAQNVNPMVTKKAKIVNQMSKLQAEYDTLDAMQEQYENSIKIMTGGYGTEDLLDKVVEATSIDKDGKPIKVTKYVFKYPETIIPMMSEGLGCSERAIDTTEDTESVETVVEGDKDVENPYL